MMEDDFFKKLRADFPDFCFKRGERFAFKPPKTIVIGPKEPNDSLLALHEIGHALCRHHDFKMDVTRVKMEREAWEKARGLCERYDIVYDEEVVESELNTYREWLDQKSRCPFCGLTRFQTSDKEYHCPRCENFY